MTLLTRLERIFFKLLVWFVSACLVGLLFLIALQVLARHSRIPNLAPQDEIVTLVFAWLVFVGSGLLVRDRDHLRVDLVDRFVSKHPMLLFVYNMITNTLIFGFLIIMTKSSLSLYQRVANRTSPMLQLPQRIWYGSLVLACFLMIFYLLLNVLKDIRDIKGKRR